ncbi:hypothetical protein HELRODRAFT_114581 [Helobdella robusta]|uniref:C2H2-type domain-containing protein n=1 Tax=Helobdella robusta TaxID=6412 RepID=T1EG33_HELRO|nr:hypothetical protein HELRODRAFT_114581 [Helobdella robusta]ESN95789.1 hypothetical protein HELRODRAFT_114581 [Helobdella robusta]
MPTYMCDKCSLVCADRNVLTIHMRCHTNEKPFKCPHCHKSFSQKGNLKVHTLNSKTSALNYECSKCDLKFKSESKLSSHLAVHDGIPLRLFSCLVCQKGFTHKGTMNNHVRFVHLSERPFTCDVCNKGFCNVSHLKRHTKLVASPTTTTTCSQCHKRFTQLSAMRSHVRSVHQRRREHHCQRCGRSFSRASHLKRHRQLHKRGSIFQCDRCSQQYRQKSSLQAHMLKHTGFKPFNCHICQKMFSKKHSLKKHQLVHSSDERSMFKCSHCPRKFTHLSTLIHHLKNLHNAIGVDELLKERSELKMKLRSEALTRDPKPWKCPHCEKEFSHKSLLSIHSRVHSKLKPFVCPVCAARFTQLGSLKSHISCVHFGEKSHTRKNTPAVSTTLTTLSTAAHQQI